MYTTRHKKVSSICSLKGIVLAAMLGLLLGNTSQADESREHVVRDLKYGLALYHFFQDKYFSSINDLLVAKQQKRKDTVDTDAELLLGSLYLSYDLHEQAGEIFEPLLDENTMAHTRDRAWFNLAKLRYRNGYMADAKKALTRIQGVLPAQYNAERLHLLANIYLQEQHYDKANELLSAFDEPSIWQSYSRFNLGTNLVAHGQLSEGISLLREVAELEAFDRESAALRDKANLALGYALMKFNRIDEATESFQQVRLQGPQSNKALLGLGWIRTLQQQHEKALVPWMELKSRSALDPAVQETVLAIPYIFEKISRPRLALEHYNYAVKSYDQQLEQLDRIVKSIKSGEFIKALKLANLNDESALSLYRSELPKSISVPYLQDLIASHEFQKTLKNFHDLHFLSYTLNRWERSLPAFKMILKERKRNFKKKLPGNTMKSRLDTLKKLRQRRNTLASELKRIEKDNNSLAMANEEEQEILDQLKPIRQRIQRIANKEDISEARGKYRLFKGIMIWKTATDFTPRLWQHKRELQALDDALQKARTSAQSLNRSRTQAPSRLTSFSNRIRGQKQRINSLQRKVATTLNEQTRYLQSLALNAVQLYRQRLTNYQVRARFSLARLYDKLAISEQLNRDVQP